MSQQDVLFAVHGTRLELISCEQELTAGSVYADRFVFTFDERWDDYAGRVALFGVESKRMTPIILSQNEQTYSCVVPPEVLQKLADGGNLYLSVWGVQNGTEAVLKTKLSTIHISESGSARLFLTPAEQNDFIESAERYLAAVEAYAASMKKIDEVKIENHHLIITFNDGSETDLGNIQGEKGDTGDTGATGAQGPRGVGISNILMNADGDLTIYTSDSAAYPVGHVKGDTGATGAKGDKGDKGEKGEKGDKGDTGATGAQGLPGVPGTDGADGEDGVSITGVTASLDAQNRRVFTFAFSDGTSQAVIVPGEVITVTDEEGEYPQAMTVQAAVQTLANACSGLDGRITANSNRITALNASKADKIILTGQCTTGPGVKLDLTFEEVFELCQNGVITLNFTVEDAPGYGYEYPGEYTIKLLSMSKYIDNGKERIDIAYMPSGTNEIRYYYNLDPTEQFFVEVY